MKVFLIDDSLAVNQRNKRLLEDFGHFEKIEMYSNPENALNVLKTDFDKSNFIELPDIIFLDIEMPEMNAFQFLEEYSKIESIVESNFKSAIIILSDHLLDNRNFDELKRFGSFGLCDQLKKPIDKQDVELILEEYIQN